MCYFLSHYALWPGQPGPGQNMRKYAQEASNAARLILLSSIEKGWATFLFATEKVGLDGEQSCQDPIRQAYKLWNKPNAYQTAVSARCFLSKACTWPCKTRSFNKALALRTISKYAAALHTDYQRCKKYFLFCKPGFRG